jgi:predicted GNAT family acetyltransferase
MIDFDEVEITDNKTSSRFEMKVDGNISYIEYMLAGNKIILTHTEVPVQLEGKGVASAMIKKVLMHVEGTDRKLVPLCPFVAAYIKRHPEWEKIVDESSLI